MLFDFQTFFSKHIFWQQMNQPRVSTVLDTGFGPDLDIIQLDNIPDRHLTYKTREYAEEQFVWTMDEFSRGCGLLPLSTIQSLVMATNVSTVQYSTVQYSTVSV